MKTKFNKSDLMELNRILADAIIEVTEKITDLNILNLFEKVAAIFEEKINAMGNLPEVVPGTITIKNQFSIYVGRGETPNGKEFSLELGAVTSSPMVNFNERRYLLSWEDIVQLAEDRGLFDSEEQNEND